MKTRSQHDATGAARRWVVSVLAALAIAASAALLIGVDRGTAASSAPLEPALEPGGPAADVAAVGGQTVDRSQGADRTPVGATSVYGAPVGTELTYRLHAEMEIGLSGRDTEPTPPVRLITDGEMTVHVLDRRDGEVLLRHRFPGMQIRVVGDPDGKTEPWTSRIADALRPGFLVRTGRDGQTLGYRFPAGTIADHRNWARNLVSAFRFVVPPSPGATWETREADALGDFRIRYESLAADGAIVTVERRKIACTLPAHAGRSEGPPELEGHATATFDPAISWLREARVDESVAWTLADLSLSVRGAFAGSLQLVRRTRRDLGVAAAWDGAWSDAAGSGERSEVLEDMRRADLERRLQGVTLPSVLERFRALLADGAELSPEFVENMRLLQDLLTLRPETAREVQQLVQGGSADATFSAALCCCLGWAGNAECQRALGTLFADGGLAPELRLAAVDGISELSEPTPDIVDGLHRCLAGADGIGDLEQVAMLALGTLAGRGATDGGGLPAVTDLLQQEATARRHGAVDLWLEALGNAGSREGLAPALRYLESDDAQVRASALSALRKLADPRAVGQITFRAERDPSPAVRARAAEILAQSGDTSGIEVLARVALEDADGAVRRVAVMGLSLQLDTTAARRALERVAAGDAISQLRELARSLLAQA